MVMWLFSLPELREIVGHIQPCSSALMRPPAWRRGPFQAQDVGTPHPFLASGSPALRVGTCALHLCHGWAARRGQPWVASVGHPCWDTGVCSGGCAGVRIQPQGRCPAGPAGALGTATSPTEATQPRAARPCLSPPPKAAAPAPARWVPLPGGEAEHGAIKGSAHRASSPPVLPRALPLGF